MNVKRTLVLAALVAALMSVVPLRLWSAVQPLSQDDVALLLIGGASEQKMMALIQQRGVDFQMNPDLAKKFHDDGASDNLIEALTKAGLKAQSAPPKAVAQPSAAPQTAPPAAAAVSQPVAPSPGPSPSLTPGTAPGPAPGASRSAEAAASRRVPNLQKAIDEATADETPAPSWGEVNSLQVAPDFALKTIQGKKIQLSDYKGKVVLLSFWATWCPPCRKEVPDFVRLQNEYGRQGFAVIAVAVGDSRQHVEDFVDRNGMALAVGLGDYKLRQLYGGVNSLPTNFLVGRDGRVHYKIPGATNFDTMANRVKYLLALDANSHTVATAPPPIAAGTLESQPLPSDADGNATSSSGPARAATPVAAAATKTAPAAAPNLSDPSPAQVQNIIQTFAAKEARFERARDNYTYHQINKVQTLDAEGNPTGSFEQDWDVLFDDNGNRIEHVTYAPENTLKGLLVTEQDIESFRSIQPFVLTTDDLPEYEVKYLGHVKVDYITAYVFSVRPKELRKGTVYFKGVVWVDDRDLQIVKSEGRTVPQPRTKNGQNLFPRFSTWRQQIDGKYWFPTFTMADDTLYFDSGPIRIKEIVKYTDYKQFKSKSRILSSTPVDNPSSNPPPKQ